MTTLLLGIVKGPNILNILYLISPSSEKNLILHSKKALEKKNPLAYTALFKFSWYMVDQTSQRISIPVVAKTFLPNSGSPVAEVSLPCVFKAIQLPLLRFWKG